jgi:hypothetical protein
MMALRARSGWGLSVCFAVFASGCDGCALDFDNVHVRAGHYVGLFAFEQDGAIVMSAVEQWDGREGELISTRVGGTSCSAGVTAGYQPLADGPIGAGWRGYMTWTAADEIGHSVVSFVDLSCARLPTKVAGVAFPAAIYPLHGGSDLWLQASDGASWIVDTAASAAQIVEPGGWGQPADDARVWVRHAGRLTLRDHVGNELRTIAEDVTEATWLLSDLSVQHLGVLWVDALGGWWLDGPDDITPKPLGADICALRTLLSTDVPPSLAIGYLRPCADGTLVVRDYLSGVETVTASAGVSAFDGRTKPMFYVAGGALGEPRGDLYMVPDGEEPRLVAAEANLLRLERYHGTAPYSLALANDDGVKGTLVRIAPDGTTEPWLDDVIAFERNVYLGAPGANFVAALTSADTETGSLYLRPDDASGSFVFLAAGVPPGRFAFGRRLLAIGYIADAADGAGRLVVHEIEGDRTVEVDVGVSEFIEVTSNMRPGVAYLIASGPHAGMWFAEP